MNFLIKTIVRTVLLVFNISLNTLTILFMVHPLIFLLGKPTMETFTLFVAIVFVLYLIWIVVGMLFTGISSIQHSARTPLKEEWEIINPSVLKVSEEVDFNRGLKITIIDEQHGSFIQSLGYNQLIFSKAATINLTTDELEALIAGQFYHLKKFNSWYRRLFYVAALPTVTLSKLLRKIGVFMKTAPVYLYLLLLVTLGYRLIAQLFVYIFNIPVMAYDLVSRKEIHQADRYVATNGYAEGLYSFLMRQMQTQPKPKFYQRFFAPYPLISQRIARVEKVSANKS